MAEEARLELQVLLVYQELKVKVAPPDLMLPACPDLREIVDVQVLTEKRVTQDFPVDPE